MGPPPMAFFTTIGIAPSSAFVTPLPHSVRNSALRGEGRRAERAGVRVSESPPLPSAGVDRNEQSGLLLSPACAT